MADENFTGETKTFSEIEKFLKEEKVNWQAIHLWVESKGYVILTESQYANLEVIDQDGDVP